MRLVLDWYALFTGDFFQLWITLVATAVDCNGRQAFPLWTVRCLSMSTFQSEVSLALAFDEQFCRWLFVDLTAMERNHLNGLLCELWFGLGWKTDWVNGWRDLNELWNLLRKRLRTIAKTVVKSGVTSVENGFPISCEISCETDLKNAFFRWVERLCY